jgi:DNA replication protein DnaC
MNLIFLFIILTPLKGVAMTTNQSTKNMANASQLKLKLQIPSDKEMEELNQHLHYLKLKGIMDSCEATALKATKEGWSYLTYLTQLVDLERNLRQERATERRINAARFPVIKTLEQFNWNWPKKINQLQVKDLFRLQFMKQQANIILLVAKGTFLIY